MERVPDRAKLRREYLWKKGKAYAAAAAAGALCLLILWHSAWAATLINRSQALLVSLPAAEQLGVTAMLFVSPVVLFLGFLSRCREELHNAAAIPYVPPVARDAVALPARQ